jgi:hypothetical protein
MIDLDSSVALAHLLAEDRTSSGISNWCPAGFLNARFGIVSTRTSSKIPHGDAVCSLIGRVAMIEMIGPVLARLETWSQSGKKERRCTDTAPSRSEHYVSFGHLEGRRPLPFFLGKRQKASLCHGQ